MAATSAPIPIPGGELRAKARGRSKSVGSSAGRNGTPSKSSGPPRGRPSAAAFQGKKGKGGGGKGSWGRIEDEIWAAEHSTSPPADELDQGVVLVEKMWGITAPEMRRFLAPKLSQYFKSGVLDDAADPIRGLDRPELNPHVVEFIVTEATERNDLERELASTLLAALAVESVFTRADLETGFDLVMTQLDDLKLDTPNAHEVVGKFIARAVADEIIAPRFVSDRPGPQDTDDSTMAFAKARGLISSPQGLERLTFVWGPSGSRSSVDELRRQIRLLLEEYLLTRDAREAETCVRELQATLFLHEVVFQAIELAIDGRSERDMLGLSALLGVLCESAVVPASQLDKGLERVIAAMGDIQLDNPKAALNFDSFCRVSPFIPRAISAKAAQLAKRAMNKSRGGRVRSVTATAAL